MSSQKNRRPPVLVVIQGEEVKRVDSNKYLGKAKCKEANEFKNVDAAHTHLQPGSTEDLYNHHSFKVGTKISVTNSVSGQM